ncbi:hypothetical protein K438DRAFT_1770479 [Mycena galopus ATCC 62051]|nr:hypothetical protein K438DRAFT_1770479 [Mycena galopus ATCC 62051]
MVKSPSFSVPCKACKDLAVSREDVPRSPASGGQQRWGDGTLCGKLVHDGNPSMKIQSEAHDRIGLWRRSVDRRRRTCHWATCGWTVRVRLWVYRQSSNDCYFCRASQGELAGHWNQIECSTMPQYAVANPTGLDENREPVRLRESSQRRSASDPRSVAGAIASTHRVYLLWPKRMRKFDSAAWFPEGIRVRVRVKEGMHTINIELGIIQGRLGRTLVPNGDDGGDLYYWNRIWVKGSEIRKIYLGFMERTATHQVHWRIELHIAGGVGIDHGEQKQNGVVGPATNDGMVPTGNWEA